MMNINYLADKSHEIICTEFEEETIRLYLDFLHNIKQCEKIKFNQLIELIKFLNDMGKTGHDST